MLLLFFSSSLRSYLIWLIRELAVYDGHLRNTEVNVPFRSVPFCPLIGCCRLSRSDCYQADPKVAAHKLKFSANKETARTFVSCLEKAVGDDLCPLTLALSLAWPRARCRGIETRFVVFTPGCSRSSERRQEERLVQKKRPVSLRPVRDNEGWK